MTRLAQRIALALSVLAPLSCATTGAPAVVAASAPRPPDVHGELLALLPPGAVAWGRFELAEARRSPHFEGALELATSLGAEVASVQRELGFDALHQADKMVFGVYLPPGTGGNAGWPVIIARGAYDRAAVLAAARVAARDAAPEEGAERSVPYTIVGQRAYMFPAADVVVVMERSLVRRVAARLLGEERRSVRDDDHFNDLWALVDGRQGPLQVAADLAAIRSRVNVRLRGVGRTGEGLDRLVAWAEVPGDVRVRAAGQAHTEAAAQEITRLVDASTRQLAGQVMVRLLGLGRLLREGVVARAEGDRVTLSVQANSSEAGRVLRISSALQELGAAE
ncbi:MAG: hypothetical protein Q8S73_22755 [Deltaproteobacteria bacterium]|nr:hypothetical protein [Myxococcales bacterium]MDP3216949.1 hypothetical protein [Deltaproteobacteria bacterium]